MKAVVFARNRDTILGQDRPKAIVELCGVPLLTRNLRALSVVGVKDVSIVMDELGCAIEESVWENKDCGIRIDLIGSDQSPAALTFDKALGGCLIIDDGYIVESRILKALLGTDETAIAYDSSPRGNDEALRVGIEDKHISSLGTTPSNGSYVGVSWCDSSDLKELRDCITSGERWADVLARLVTERDVLAVDVEKLPRYVAEIRRSIKPYWFEIDGKRDIDRAKRALIDASQKRTLDILAWYVHRPLESFLVYYSSELPITPNQLSVLVNLIAYVVTVLFFTGHLLPGVLVAFAVNVLDGVDGKQARVKGLTTKFGHIEHSFDLLFEQSWYIAFAWAAFSLGGREDILPLLLCITLILFDSFARHVAMQFRQVMGVALADYGGFDRAFRRFDGRRNIYWIYMSLSVLFGRPLYGLVAMTSHAFLTGLIYCVRAWKHLRAADLKGFGPENR